MTEDSKEKIWSALIILAVVAFAVWKIYSTLTTDADDKYEWAEDGKIIFTEAKCLTGSIFHKDSLILPYYDCLNGQDDNIEIYTQSFFNKKKTIYPYRILKEITFSKAFNGYKVVIKYPGSFLGTDSTTLYFNKKETYDFLKDVLKDNSKNRCVITYS